MLAGKGNHSRPSKADNTGPRRYTSALLGSVCANLMRMAMLSSSASLAIVPTCMSALKPERPMRLSPGMPHKGADRGKSMNSTSMMGAPSKAI